MSSVYDDAAQALRSSPLYVDQQALTELEEEGDSFDAAAQDEVLRRLEDASPPIFVAVLPAAARQAGDAVSLGQATGRNGTYLVVLPDGETSAASNVLPGGESTRLANGAEGGDTESIITEFIDGAEEVAADRDGGGGGSTGDGDGDGSGWIPLGIIAAVGGGGLLLYRRNKRNRERAELEPVRTALDEDITAYGEELTALDLDVRTPGAVPEEAQQEYARALDLYDRAKAAGGRVERTQDLQPVTAALDEGRWLLARVKARMAGDPPPERRPPCFFDPRHGPSVEDVTWAPPGGALRDVPACAADATRIKDGLDPDVRLVPVGEGERRPYWDAGPAYGGWASGYFGGFLPGMLWGTLLGSSFGGWGVPYAGDAGAESAGDAGGFDSGGWGDGGGFDGGGFDGGGFDGGGW